MQNTKNLHKKPQKQNTDNTQKEFIIQPSHPLTEMPIIVSNVPPRTVKENHALATKTTS